jgi:hypothetical protein
MAFLLSNPCAMGVRAAGKRFHFKGNVLRERTSFGSFCPIALTASSAETSHHYFFA